MTTSPGAQNIGFRYGTNQSSLTSTVYYNGGISDASGSYSVSVTGLAESTTYYYQAFMDVWDGTQYVTIESSVKSFTTTLSAATASLGYLICYEVPEVLTSGNMVSGNEAENRGYMWHRFSTLSQTRAVATHTYMDNSKKVRNYTVMLDGSKKAPLWTAHAMHADMWKNNGVGRNDNWTNDPAFTGLGSWQQTGVSDYSKGHFVASSYRQTTVAQNKQTFYYSNQAPQNQDFNGGIWNKLEEQVKAAAPTGRDTLYVVTGVLYEGTAQYSDGIQIPSHFYKCLMMCSFKTNGEMDVAKGCAYVFANKSGHTNSVSALADYMTTIDAIESRAGFNFFPRVPEKLQTQAESTATPLW